MKHKSATSQLGLVLVFLLACSQNVFAKGTPIGDIMLSGRVERSGQRLINNTSLFSGDVLRTLENGAGVVRIGRGRLELSQLSEVQIVSEKPLKIVLKSGRLDFNFPVGTLFEIVTPQLKVTPTKSLDSYSGIVTAEPKKEDRVVSRKGGYSILEREAGGERNAIVEGEVLIAALVMPPLPQGTAQPVARIILLEPANTAQVFVARAANPKNFSTRATLQMGLDNGDRVQAQQGSARIAFTSSPGEIALRPGTEVGIREEPAAGGGLLRSISQAAGSLWFSIQRTTGTETKLETRTAVAAIRGTEGQHDINFDDETTFSLTVGETEITENLTGSKVTLRAGQTVTAIRGIGFSAVTALIAAIGPSVGPTAGPGGAGAGGGGVGAGGGGAGAGAGGAGAGGATGGATGATAGAATATTTTAASAAVSTVSSVTSALVATVPAAAAAAASTVITAQQEETPPASSSEPLSRPGVG